MSFNPSGLAIPLFFLLMLLEYWQLRRRGLQKHRYNDSVNSLSMGLLLLTSDALLKATTFAVFIAIYEHHTLFEFSSTDWLTWLLFFVLVDLCYYAFHRSAHSINILWGAHVGHHQSEEYNLTTALRQSAFQYGFSWVFYLPLAWLGCPPEVFLVLFVLLKVYQFWLHTQLIDKIPLIEGVLSTPSSHRVHHAKNPRYIDRNYGGTLVIWDRLFGSWQAEIPEDPCHYGTTKPLDTLDPIKANLQHWSMLLKDTVHTKKLRDKFILWFKATGWRPEDCRNMQFSLQHDGCSQREKFNPKTSRKVNIYGGVSLMSLSLFAVMFLFKAPILLAWELLIGSFVIVSGLWFLNRFLENNFRFAFFEAVRVLIFMGLFIHVSVAPVNTQLVNRIEIHAPIAQIYNYVSTPDLWHEWHSQSLWVKPKLNRSLQQADVFEELIQTQLGQDHLSWQVKVSESPTLWVATAYNHDKDVNIRLQYALEQNGPHSEFVRTLDYEVPNFLYHLLNSLYFKKQMTKKSAHALEALKIKIELG